MSIDAVIRLPELQEGSQQQELRQIRSYLYQLAQQLQFALGSVSQAQAQTEAAVQSVAEKSSPTANFGQLKSLIIKSADIVDAYYEQISRRLEGIYVAQSAFGTFAQETAQQITENSEEITRSFFNQQQILGSLAQLETQLLEVNAYVKTGLLYSETDGTPIYGVEIGQQTWENEAVTFRKFTRLSAGKLSFYDSADTEVAYVSDSKLYITEAEIGTLTARSAAVSILQLGSYTLTSGQDGHLILN